MNENEVLEQLQSLIDDRNAFISENQNDCEIFKKDKLALEKITDWYKHNKICLAGYRGSILQSSGRNHHLKRLENLMVENQQLKSQLKLKEKQLKKANDVIDEIKKYLDGACEMSCYTKSLSLDGENIDDLYDILNKRGGTNE